MRKQSTAAWRRMSAAGIALARGITFFACLAMAHSALAEPVAVSSTNAGGRFPAGSIESVAAADKALAAVARERSAIEARYAEEERACHPKFFATSCIEEAKERRRKAIMELRAVENEANVYKRRARVEARDKALEDRHAKKEAPPADQLRIQDPDLENALRERKVQPGKDVELQGAPSSDRLKKHQAKLERLRAEEAVKANERAENIAEYEKKVEAAKARQQEIAARKAEKEQKRQMKEEQASGARK